MRRRVGRAYLHGVAPILDRPAGAPALPGAYFYWEAEEDYPSSDRAVLGPPDVLIVDVAGVEFPAFSAVWGVDETGRPYMDTAGAAPGEHGDMILMNSGRLMLVTP